MCCPRELICTTEKSCISVLFCIFTNNKKRSNKLNAIDYYQIIAKPKLPTEGPLMGFKKEL